MAPCRAVLAVLLWLAVVHVAPPQLPAVAGQNESTPSPAAGADGSAPSPATGPSGPGGSPPSPSPGSGGSPLPPFASPGGSLPPSAVSPGGSPPLPIGAGLGGSPPSHGKECQSTCSGIDIPFPFGIGPDSCSLSNEFSIECRNDTGNRGFKPFVGNSDVEVIDISLSTGEVRVYNPISYYCGYNTSSRTMEFREWDLTMTGTPFTFSDTANKFTVVGCRTVAYIGDSIDDNAATYKTGCVSMCRLDDLSPLTNGTCSGMGCCQTAIPSGLQDYTVWFDKRLNDTERCSYAVLMEESSFTFSTSYVTSLELHDIQVPVVLDWVVGSANCSIAPKNPGYACVSKNSSCIDVASRRGYICSCTEGFQGNPYVVDGCKDIDECSDPKKYSCFGECINTNGTFACSCPAGTRGNATIDGQCYKDPFPRRAKIAVVTSAVGLVLLVALLAIKAYYSSKKRRADFLVLQMSSNFEQHGGQLLKRMLKTEDFNFTLFDRRDIEMATDTFHKDNIVGEGVHGSVYKGTISVKDTRTTIAVKWCKEIDQSRKDEFVQELAILCRLNHSNIIKLLGCCLHFEAPVLVYEFMQNGTLNNLLHGKSKRCVTMATRLRIIAEVAEALSYLHSPTCKTLHGDVKPENILLDKGWVAKVSDFGCSTINDNIQVVPKGTIAYLDPEFLIDSQITDKTDVYSLGVVLMELLTGKKPVIVKGQRNPTKIFQEAIANGTLKELLDADVMIEEGAMGVICQAAELSRRCTAIPGNTRPIMELVAKELRRLSNEMPEHPEALQALEGTTSGYINVDDENQTTGSYTVGSNIVPLSTELAR